MTIHSIKFIKFMHILCNWMWAEVSARPFTGELRLWKLWEPGYGILVRVGWLVLCAEGMWEVGTSRGYPIRCKRRPYHFRSSNLRSFWMSNMIVSRLLIRSSCFRILSSSSSCCFFDASLSLEYRLLMIGSRILTAEPIATIMMMNTHRSIARSFKNSRDWSYSSYRSFYLNWQELRGLWLEFTLRFAPSTRAAFYYSYHYS